MRNDIVSFDSKAADELAEKYFLDICGFKKDSEKHKEMIIDGMRILEKIKSGIRVRAVVESFGKETVRGSSVSIKNIEFRCSVFEQMNSFGIQRIYAYILTAGECEIHGDSLLERMYADFWGTAYVDAGRDLLKSHIQEKHGALFVTDSFGPGYYGMEVSQLGNFFRILDGSKIGVRLNESGMMVPIKSCAGFYAVADSGRKLPETECMSCGANAGGCRFCRKGREQE